MNKTLLLLAGAVAMLAIATGPALAQDGMKGTHGFASPDQGLQALPRDATTPAERAQVRRDWNDMAREWEERLRGQAPGDQSMPWQSNRGGDVRGRARAEEADQFGRNPCAGRGRCGN